MKPSSGTLWFLRIFVGVVALVFAVGYYGHVRAQSGTGSVRVPLRPLAPLSSVLIPPVFGMEGIIADKTAAIELGKALFWDMQAGSDDIQACASCHFNAGADSRANNEVNPGQAGGDNTFQLGVPFNGSLGPNYHYKAGSSDAGFGGYHDGDYPFRKLADVNDRFSVTSDVNDVSGSQGVFGLTNDTITLTQAGGHNVGDGNPGQGGGHEGADDGDGPGLTFGNNTPHLPGGKHGPANSSGTNTSSTNSQSGKKQNAGAAGTVTSVESTTASIDPVFSYPSQVDPTQRINTRRVTGRNTPSAVDAVFNFRNFWDGRAQNVCNGVNPENFETCPAGTNEYSLMEYNFSLFWGVAIQMYESTLVADQTPLDKYLEQQQTYTLVGDNLKNQYTIQLKPGITPYTLSIVGLNPTLDASDQDTYAFDDGQGRVMGGGVNGATIDYASGTLSVFFSNPPVSQVPILINYSVGAVPLTSGQLRGLNLFQTKAGCIVCHGGPELSNAAVGTVTGFPVERMIMEDDSARVYDTGYYHIGVRPTAEDGGLAGNDPVAGLPLSQAEILRQHVCDGGYETVIVPGRRGDGIAPSPMNCNDDIARGGFFKAPQLRNVALTAPYFHNGSQLTLEQVVEFYNRGGDFNTVEEVKYMDPDIELLGLTAQEKIDLVDFLRNGLTDPRTVTQAAPFDHPQLFTPNGHPHSANGYPITPDPKHPDRATDQLLEIPAVGAQGGKPLPTFLENLLGGQNAGSN